MSNRYVYEHKTEVQTTPNKNQRNKKRRNKKRIGALLLSGFLFGGVAAGTFYGINSFADNEEALLQTEQAGTNASASLLKATSTSTQNKGPLDVSDIAEEAMPSIVAITSKSVQEVQNYFGMFGRNGQILQQEVESCGSGIIIGQNDSELLVVTNNHVVEGADTLSVCFIDDQAYEAVVKSTDSGKDLAVVAVKLEDISDDTMSQISIASIGDSSSLRVGEQVVAIGNALGYGQSVTTGIVSATNRTFSSYEKDMDYDGISLIQTDAAINPGNSGGALLNMDGQVIGINSAKLASTDVEGIGYALSINDVYDTIESLMNAKTRTKAADGSKASIGVSGIDVSARIQEVYNIPSGVFVAEVTPGGAAEAAGIMENSIITGFDGRSVSSISQLKEILAYYEEGETVEVTIQVMGENGYTEQNVSVTLGKADDSQEESQGMDDNQDELYQDFLDGQDNPIERF